MGKLQSNNYYENMLVSNEDIVNIVNKLKCGKSSGPDGISAESLKFSLIYVLLSLCFSRSLAHGHFPKFLMEIIIVPIVNKIYARRTRSFSEQECNLVAVLV